MKEKTKFRPDLYKWLNKLETNTWRHFRTKVKSNKDGRLQFQIHKKLKMTALSGIRPTQTYSCVVVSQTVPQPYGLCETHAGIVQMLNRAIHNIQWIINEETSYVINWKRRIQRIALSTYQTTWASISFLFSVEVSKDSRTASASISLTVVEGNPPLVWMGSGAPSIKVSETQRVVLNGFYNTSIQPAKVEWSCIRQQGW